VRKSIGEGKNVAKKPKPKPDDKEQSQRFVETAKALEADESGKVFERAFKKVARPQKGGAKEQS
jgi:hypothetical protein